MENISKQPSRIMERVAIDHAVLDLILLDDESLVPLGRPHLVLLIDEYSHCVVGFNLSFNQPSDEPACNALLSCMSRKGYVKKAYPIIQHEWPCYGKPETLVVDDGVEFSSASFQRLCMELGISIQYKKTWLKPLAERMFGIINHKLLELIPRTTLSNLQEKGQGNLQRVRLSTLLELLHYWIIDVYHYEPDSRNGDVPILSWQGEKVSH